MDTFDYDKVNYTPDADGTLGNMDFGGLDLPPCTQELTDNSLEYGAKNIHIYLLSDGLETNGLPNKFLEQVIVKDDGVGMNAQTLSNAVILAKKHKHVEGGIGKFGMGLKNATMAIGNQITIVTKTEDGTTRGVYMDLKSMRKHGTFKPTKICEDANQFKDFIDQKDIFESFLAQKSGTLISVRSIKMNIEDVEMMSENLRNYLGLGYKTIDSKIQIHTILTREPLFVDNMDVFYRNDSEKLDYCCDTKIRVYVKKGGSNVNDVIEILENKRIKSLKKSTRFDYYKGTRDKPIYLKHQRRPENQKRGRKFISEEINPKDLETENYFDIQIRFISIKEEHYSHENDQGKYDDDQVTPNRRRGIWFYRGIRCVGKCVNYGGPLDDYSNRQRMEVIYPSELDYHMGMRIQKQMSQITSTRIFDVLTHIWEQQNTTLIKQRKNKKKEEKKDKPLESISSTESEESQQSNEDKDLRKTETVPEKESKDVFEVIITESSNEYQQQNQVQPEEEEQSEEKSEEKSEQLVDEEQSDEPEEQQSDGQSGEQTEEEKKSTSILAKFSHEQTSEDDEVIGEDREQNEDQSGEQNDEQSEEQNDEQSDEQTSEIQSDQESFSEIQTNLVTVSSHYRTTTKSEKDVIQISNLLLNALRKKLPKVKLISNSASTEFTELYKSAENLLNYLNKI